MNVIQDCGNAVSARPQLPRGLCFTLSATRRYRPNLAVLLEGHLNFVVAFMGCISIIGKVLFTLPCRPDRPSVYKPNKVGSLTRSLVARNWVVNAEKVKVKPIQSDRHPPLLAEWRKIKVSFVTNLEVVSCVCGWLVVLWANGKIVADSVLRRVSIGRGGEMQAHLHGIRWVITFTFWG
ncbi:unnamed protein product [Protopolystoma xenopodis]|uniref:Uncharacterized protein n=1 Tax=Protopolystoma xenopodis TaxID=117903 RepID=A0A3S5FFZ5_9PLAT|nr:unnamed protein product [Protopolystoma xenopodis]